MKKMLLLFALFIALVSLGIYLRTSNELAVIEEQCLKAGGTYDAPNHVCDLPPITDPTPQPSATSTPSATELLADLIVVDEPAASSTVSSPLTVTGEARGYWFFEASFPVELINADGEVIASGPAQAQGEWMTEDFVPFEIELGFENQVPGTWGTLVLKKDNPSGLPENDNQLEVPVEF